MLQLKRIATEIGKIPSSLALKIKILGKIRLNGVIWGTLLDNILKITLFWFSLLDIKDLETDNALGIPFFLVQNNYSYIFCSGFHIIDII